jgi:hypothetical protein
MAPSVARESTLHCKLNSQLHWAGVRSILAVGPEIDSGNLGIIVLLSFRAPDDIGVKTFL